MGAGQAGTLDIPKEQLRAFDAIKGELDPDKAIALVGDFAGKYPESPLLSYVYSYGAMLINKRVMRTKPSSTLKKA